MQNAILDDADIAHVLSGDQNAFSHLVTRYEARVRGYCTVMLANRAEADDAAQDIFIKAYQNLEKFRSDSLFSTWLHRITVNHCMDILRKRSRSKTESWDHLLAQEGEKMEAALIDNRPPENTQDQIDHVTLLLSRLPEKLREIFVLREMHSLSYEELAHTLHCSLDAVKSRLKRARQEIEKITKTEVICR